jgi:transposase InsO family protein
MRKNNHFNKDKPSQESLFRFIVVSQVRARIAQGESRAEAVIAVSNCQQVEISGRLVLISRRTIYRWLKAFESDELDCLEPKKRKNTQFSKVISKNLLDFLEREKDNDERASIPELIRKARTSGIVAEGEKINRSTIYRILKKMNVPVVRGKRASTRDSKRFAYPHRMDLILSDGKHFRVGVTRAKRVAMFFLDDCSRFGVTCVVGTSENTTLFLRGLHASILQQGIAGIYYLDHGPAFRSDDTKTVIQQLGALLLHGEVAYPEGHGKIERFHSTVIEAVLRHLDRRPDVDPSCEALELRINHWLTNIYNHTVHQSLQGLTPFKKFTEDTKPLKFPEGKDQLDGKFKVTLSKKVSADHVISVDGIYYEVPRGMARQQIQVHRQVLDGTLQVVHEGKLVKIHPVNLTANALSDRGKPKPDPESTDSFTKGAADLAFERDLKPVIDLTGGFSG